MVVVGCDWSRNQHDVCVMNQQGKVLVRRKVEHSPQGFAEFRELLAGLEDDPSQIWVGLELHNGALLAWLLEQRYTVYGLNPKSAERFRDRYRPAGGKDDEEDARVLADAVRTDAHHLQRISPQSEATEELREIVELRATLVKERTRHIHRLRAVLGEWCPALSALCRDLTRRWPSHLLHEFPLHEDVIAAHGNRINHFARQNGLHPATRRRLHEVRAQRPLFIPESRKGPLRREIRFLVDQITQLSDHIEQLHRHLEGLLARHPDAPIFQSLPATATATVATFLAAFGEDRDGSPPWRELAAFWGVAPLTKQSGKHRHVYHRWSCNPSMKQALTLFAFQTARTEGCWAKEYYAQKRKQKAEHYTVLRCLAQRWVKIIYRMWQDRSTYAEHIHATNRARRGPIAA